MHHPAHHGRQKQLKNTGWDVQIDKIHIARMGSQGRLPYVDRFGSHLQTRAPTPVADPVLHHQLHLQKTNASPNRRCQQPSRRSIVRPPWLQGKAHHAHASPQVRASERISLTTIPQSSIPQSSITLRLQIIFSSMAGRLIFRSPICTLIVGQSAISVRISLRCSPTKIVSSDFHRKWMGSKHMPGQLE